ncbi:tail fiber domain-containing protein [Streptomyces sp. H34-S4]|uniref:tail fiber domain-containing protein n=1 Tax=Streptomyces sp. H34-S4 TaxID=2996463 RepID=UPI0022719367|nr:tail fiber domain-containing protein [Streptomyces sp. H34-S4]MCY0933622.1 tail fiber domain-containing protein [Streptomyces sp. H34-S4]
MAQSSYPFDGQTTSETQYSQFFRELQDNGVCADPTATDLRVSGDGSGMNVKVQPGKAILRGHAYASTAVETLIISAADASPRTDRVILRLDPAANSIVLAVIKGTPGGGIPTLNQTDAGIYEMGLATITVGASATTILAGDVTQQRRFVGSRIGIWSTTLRPTTPRQGRLGYNVDANAWEFWDGTTWKDLAPIVSWSTITGKPSTYPPSTHSHLATGWATITEKPILFPPAPHDHAWEDLTNAPSTYPPSTHFHTWDSIQGKPWSFPPDGHTHGYLEAGDTISWANGSKQPHSRAVSGSGTYYAVWVRGDGGFCRNTSSIKFKEHVRDFEIEPEGVLALKPKIYDRKAEVNEAGEVEEGAKDEVGLIAEEVAEHLPWIVNYLDGEIDGLRYDLLGVALLPVVQRQEARIRSLEERLAALEAKL